MLIDRLRTNQMSQPLGHDLSNVTLSWQVSATHSQNQHAARVVVSLDETGDSIIYDSGKRKDIHASSFSVPHQFEQGRRYWWRVEVWGDQGDYGVSAATFFEGGRPDGPWHAKFIAAGFPHDILEQEQKTFQLNELDLPASDTQPHPIFYRDIDVPSVPVQARAYVCCLGSFELFLNGEKQGDEVLLPGIYAYDAGLRYQTFELHLREGRNRIEASIGNGWYIGRYGLLSRMFRYGDGHEWLCEIVITYEDGRTEIIGTDAHWRCRRSPVRGGSIYDGEWVDARLETDADYPVRVSTRTTEGLEPRHNPRIRVQEYIAPVKVSHEDGCLLLDFGQNLVGWVEFERSDEDSSGHEVTLWHGEVLQDGRFYRDNLRTARAEFHHVGNGRACQVRPQFTFFGFRYCLVEGWTGSISSAYEVFRAAVIHSDMPAQLEFSCGHPGINQLMQNIHWGIRGNFLDLPTDCPQRDERCGWTGDAQVICDSALLMFDCGAIYEKFLEDLQREQARLSGSVPHIVPTAGYKLNGACGWADAVSEIPRMLWWHTADKRQLERAYPAMIAWHKWVERQAVQTEHPDLWLGGRHFGDWLALDGRVPGGVYGRTDPDFLASAWFYRSTESLAIVAEKLGRLEEGEAWRERASRIHLAFCDRWFSSTGRLVEQTQTAYALAISFGLYPDGLVHELYNGLAQLMHQSGGYLETGFLGTPWLCHALSDAGMHGMAWDIVLNEGFPGWLFAVNMGATTIWERWNSLTPDGRVSSTGMNSLNHFAYGSVASWLVRRGLGIRPHAEGAGFRHAVVAPSPDVRIGHMRASLQTASGEYKVGWTLEGDDLVIDVGVPFACAVDLVLPRATGQALECCYGQEAYPITELQPLDEPNVEGAVGFRLAPGSYRFRYRPYRPWTRYYSIDSRYQELMADERTRSVISRYLPRYGEEVAFYQESEFLDQILSSPFCSLDSDTIAALDAELARIERKD